MDINQELSRIDEEREARAQQSDAEEERVQERMDALRERLRNGETTGDPLKDQLIIRRGRYPEEQAAPYYAIRDELEGNVGELVLMVLREETDSGFGSRESSCWGSSHFPVYDTDLRLGVLTGGMKIPEEGGVDIETGKYVGRSDSYHCKGWKLEERDMPLHFLDFFHFSRPLMPQLNHRWSEDRFGDKTVHLYVGQEVEDYFCPREDPRLLADELKLHWYVDDRVQNYVDALAMLGVIPSENVKASHDAIRFKQQATLVEKITESVRKGDVKETRSNLAKALVMGLHERDLKLSGDNGVIDVKDYVTTLCQAYGVKV